MPRLQWLVTYVTHKQGGPQQLTQCHRILITATILPIDTYALSITSIALVLGQPNELVAIVMSIWQLCHWQWWQLWWVAHRPSLYRLPAKFKHNVIHSSSLGMCSTLSSSWQWSVSVFVCPERSTSYRGLTHNPFSLYKPWNDDTSIPVFCYTVWSLLTTFVLDYVHLLGYHAKLQ